MSNGNRNVITDDDRTAVLEVYAFVSGRYDRTAALEIASEALRTGRRELSILEAYSLTGEILAESVEDGRPKDKAA